MRRARDRLLAAGRALTMALGVLLLSRGAGAAPFDPGGHDWEGYADFADQLRAKAGASIVVSRRLDFGAVRAGDALVLVHPEGALDVESLASFMASGGRVVLLDDFGSGDALLRRFGIRRIPLPASPADELRHNPELAIAVAVGDNDLVRGVARVVLNHATGLAHPALTPLLEVRAPGAPPVVVGLVGQTGRGKLAVVGDASALMNSMLRYPGNAELGRNLAEFVARPGGKLYLATGRLEQTGRFAGDAAPEGSGASSATLRDLVRLGPRAELALAAALGLGVVVWIGGVAGRTYRVTPPRMTRVIPLFTQGGAAGRAAAIGARGVPRDAAMLEIGKALEERLALALGLSNVPSHEALVGQVAAAGLVSAPSALALKKLLAEVSHIDTLVRAGRQDALRRITDGEVLAADRIGRAILADLGRGASPGRAA